MATNNEGDGDRPAPLYELYLGGAIAMCDAWAVDKYPIHGVSRQAQGQLAMASMTAPPSTVRGMRANLRVQKEATTANLMAYTIEDPRTPSLQGLGIDLLADCKYTQVRVGRLRGYHHAIAMAQSAPTGYKADDEATHGEPDEVFYVFARSSEDGPALFYKEFIKRSPTPTIPEWTDAMWGMCASRGEIRELDTFGIHGWRCDMHYDETERQIRAMVANAQLPIPGA